MDEEILLSIVGADEAKPLVVAEPLNGSGGHAGPPRMACCSPRGCFEATTPGAGTAFAGPCWSGRSRSNSTYLRMHAVDDRITHRPQCARRARGAARRACACAPRRSCASRRRSGRRARRRAPRPSPAPGSRTATGMNATSSDREPEAARVDRVDVAVAKARRGRAGRSPCRRAARRPARASAGPRRAPSVFFMPSATSTIPATIGKCR